MLANVDDAVCRLPLRLALLGIFVLSPGALLAIAVGRVCCVLGTNDVGIRIDSSKLGRVGYCQGEEFPLDVLKVLRVVEEDLEKDWWC